MTRNWGLPQKPNAAEFRRARTERPLAVLALSAVYGVIGAAIAAISFADARALGDSLFHGASLVAAVVAAGFGCWTYVWLARPRFAAHFTGEGDAFSDLLRFYFVGALALVALVAAGKAAEAVLGDLSGILVLCISGGAGAAAAFQTVLAFVPHYKTS
jgi:hypothetical protein